MTKPKKSFLLKNDDISDIIKCSISILPELSKRLLRRLYTCLKSMLPYLSHCLLPNIWPISRAWFLIYLQAFFFIDSNCPCCLINPFGCCLTLIQCLCCLIYPHACHLICTYPMSMQPDLDFPWWQKHVQYHAQLNICVDFFEVSEMMLMFRSENNKQIPMSTV